MRPAVVVVVVDDDRDDNDYGVWKTKCRRFGPTSLMIYCTTGRCVDNCRGDRISVQDAGCRRVGSFDTAGTEEEARDLVPGGIVCMPYSLSLFSIE